MVLNELVYESNEALMELCTFLNSQSDQVNRVIFNTQDENLEFLFEDPSNGMNYAFKSFYPETFVTGIGMMYRIIDTSGIFNELKAHNFGNQDCKLNISIEDDFFDENNGETIVHFNKGVSNVVTNGEYEVKIHIGISEFSSLIVGAVDFYSLLRLGHAKISDTKYADIINGIFRTNQKPINIVHF